VDRAFGLCLDVAGRQMVAPICAPKPEKPHAPTQRVGLFFWASAEGKAERAKSRLIIFGTHGHHPSTNLGSALHRHRSERVWFLSLTQI
jgi:hypothetical protein